MKDVRHATRFLSLCVGYILSTVKTQRCCIMFLRIMLVCFISKRLTDHLGHARTQSMVVFLEWFAMGAMGLTSSPPSSFFPSKRTMHTLVIRLGPLTSCCPLHSHMHRHQVFNTDATNGGFNHGAGKQYKSLSSESYLTLSRLNSFIPPLSRRTSESCSSWPT